MIFIIHEKNSIFPDVILLVQMFQDKKYLCYKMRSCLDLKKQKERRKEEKKKKKRKLPLRVLNSK